MLDIVIVNWNSGSQLAGAIISIKEHHANLVTSVIVIDNASSDDSLRLLNVQAGNLPFHFLIVKNNDNLGFAAACNQGANLGKSDYLLFLNPDTRLKRNSLSVPLRFMELEENARIGICGIQLIDELLQVSRTCSRFPSPEMYWANAIGLSRLKHLHHLGPLMLEWDHQDNREVPQVMGAFFFVRRDLWQRLCGFDERYFVYFEEVDFSLRARSEGFVTVYLKDAQVYHKGGGTSRQVIAKRLYYSLRSRLLYGGKHFTLQKRLSLYFVTICIEPWTRIIQSMVQFSISKLVNTIRAYGMLYLNLLRMLGK